MKWYCFTLKMKALLSLTCRYLLTVDTAYCPGKLLRKIVQRDTVLSAIQCLTIAQILCRSQVDVEFVL